MGLGNESMQNNMRCNVRSVPHPEIYHNIISQHTTNVHIFKYPNVQMFQCSDVQMCKCPNVKMSKCPNVQLSECLNLGIFKRPHLKISRRSNSRNVQISKCPNGHIPKCPHVLTLGKLSQSTAVEFLHPLPRSSSTLPVSECRALAVR